MTLVTFECGGSRHIGTLRAGEADIVDLTATGDSCFADMLALIEGGEGALDAARTALTRAEVVVPVGSGTVGGGCGLEHGRFLAHGDVIELEVEGLGRQRNRVVFPDRAA